MSVLPSGFTRRDTPPQTIYSERIQSANALHDADRREPRKATHEVANVAVTYLNSRGVHEFYTNFINANAPGCSAASQIFYQYQSEGVYKQNQLIVNGSVRMGTRLTMFGYYVLNYANSDTDDPTYVPSDPLNVSADYGRAAFDYRNRLFMGGTVGLPKGFRLSPFLIASSGPPFNITTGEDLFGDAQFNSRPASAIVARWPPAWCKRNSAALI